MASDNRFVVLTNGLAVDPNANYIGMTVGEVRSLETVQENLGINGNEQVTVTRGGLVVTSNDQFVLRGGDEVQFIRETGTKGFAPGEGDTGSWEGQ